MRHANAVAFLAVILAVALAPAIALRFFPREASALMLTPVSTAIGSMTDISSESVAAFWIMISFVISTVTASGLVAVLAEDLRGTATNA